MTELRDHALVCREAPGLLEDSKCASPWPRGREALGESGRLGPGRRGGGERESVCAEESNISEATV